MCISLADARVCHCVSMWSNPVERAYTRGWELWQSGEAHDGAGVGFGRKELKVLYPFIGPRSESKVQVWLGSAVVGAEEFGQERLCETKEC